MRGHAFLVAGYVPGNSPVHRLPLGVKALLLLAVAVLCLASPLVSERAGVVVTSATLAVVAASHFVAGLAWPRMWRAVRMMLIFLVLIAAYQWWQHGPWVAWQVIALARFGADPERFSLTVALMLRSIPYVIGAFADVRDAARARGLERNLLARSLPVVIATVGYARATGEALAARGLGDPDDDTDPGTGGTGGTTDTGNTAETE